MSDVDKAEPGYGSTGKAAAAPVRDKPWVMRTYSGHSTAKASNELYRTNLAKGQTGLSIAFDLPTQIGYDPTTRRRSARSARSVCPSPTSDTWPNCSTRSRWSR
jgi:methylmalonyl-CoA mutase N-terminal domain/subunit